MWVVGVEGGGWREWGVGSWERGGVRWWVEDGGRMSGMRKRRGAKDRRRTEEKGGGEKLRNREAVVRTQTALHILSPQHPASPQLDRHTLQQHAGPK